MLLWLFALVSFFLHDYYIAGEIDPRKSIIPDSTEESLRRPITIVSDVGTEQNVVGNLGATGLPSARKLGEQLLLAIKVITKGQCIVFA